MGAETWEHPVSEQGEFISIGDNQVNEVVRYQVTQQTRDNVKLKTSCFLRNLILISSSTEITTFMHLIHSQKQKK